METWQEQIQSFWVGSEAWMLLLWIFCRLVGIFLLSPLLSMPLITTTVRLFLISALALLLWFALFSHYLGAQALYPIRGGDHSLGGLAVQLCWVGALELLVGYLMGFCFLFVWEALRLTGLLVDTLSGLSAGRVFDPLTQTFHTLTGQWLLVGGLVLFLLSDFHHVLLRLLVESYTWVPIGHFLLSGSVLEGIAQGMTQSFSFAFQLGAVPLTLLALCLTGLALVARALGGVSLAAWGFPIKVMVSFLGLFLAVREFPTFLAQTFWYSTHLVARLLKGGF